MLLNIVGSVEAEGALQCFENCDDAFWMQFLIDCCQFQNQYMPFFFFFAQKFGTFELLVGKTSEGLFSTSFEIWSSILKKTRRYIKFPSR